MRILLCNGRFFPSSGPERYLFGLWSELEARGHEVVPLGVAFPETSPEVSTRYFVPPAAPAGKLFFADYKDELGPTAKLRMFGRSVWSRSARRQALRAIDEQGIDLVYLLNVANTLSPSLIGAAAARGVPVVMRLSDFGLACPSYGFIRDGKPCRECFGGLGAAVRYRCLQGSVQASVARVIGMQVHRWLGVYERVGRFVCPTSATAEMLSDLGVAPERVVMVPTFTRRIDPEYLPREREHFLYVGRLSPEKGLPTLLAAYARSGCASPLRIAGAGIGSYESQMREEAAALGIADRVEFLGFQSWEALEPLIRRARLSVVPARWLENGPNSLIESLGVGTPVVGTDAPGVADYLPAEAGVQFPVDGVDELATLLRRAEQDPAWVEKLGRGALRVACARHSPAAHLDTLLEVFESLLVQPAGSRPRRPAAAAV